MKISRRFTNFALQISIIALLWVLNACKGRTMENMEPTGDTVEVVIMQPTVDETNN